jgi:hypothetical protein
MPELEQRDDKDKPWITRGAYEVFEVRDRSTADPLPKPCFSLFARFLLKEKEKCVIIYSEETIYQIYKQ